MKQKQVKIIGVRRYPQVIVPVRQGGGSGQSGGREELQVSGPRSALPAGDKGKIRRQIQGKAERNK